MSSGPPVAATVAFPRSTILLLLAAGPLLAGYYEWRSWQPGAGPGFPLDDAWIHAQFARNLAEGRGFSYTGPDWVAGSTAPAWTLLLALGYLIVPSIVVTAKVLGILLQVLSGWLAARLAWSLTGSRVGATVAGVGVVQVPVMVWGAVSGMEVPLSAALVLGGCLAYLGVARRDSRGPLWGLFLLGLAALARPENLALAGLFFAHFVLRGRRPRAATRRAVAGALVVAAAVSPSVALSYGTLGRPLPTTFYAKSGPGLVRALETRDVQMLRRNVFVHGPLAVRQFAATLWSQLWIVSALVPLGVVALIMRREREAGVLLLLAVVAVPFAMGLLAPQRLKPDNVRYAGQLVVLGVVLAAAAADRLSRAAPRRLGGPVALAISGVFAWQGAAGAPDFVRGVKNIQELHVVTAEWMRRHLPPGSVVAANDVGAIAYFSGLRVLDIEGLVSPEALAYRQRVDRGLAFVEATRPDFVVIFPHWYPEIPARPELFTEVHRVTISDNLVSAGEALVIYQTPWARHPPHERPFPPARRRWPA